MFFDVIKIINVRVLLLLKRCKITEFFLTAQYLLMMKFVKNAYSGIVVRKKLRIFVA